MASNINDDDLNIDQSNTSLPDEQKENPCDKNKSQNVFDKNKFKEVGQALINELIKNSAIKKQDESDKQLNLKTLGTGDKVNHSFQIKLDAATNHSQQSVANSKMFDVLYMIQQGVVSYSIGINSIMDKMESTVFKTSVFATEVLLFCVKYGNRAICSEVCSLEKLGKLEHIISTPQRIVVAQKIIDALQIWRQRFQNTPLFKNIVIIQRKLMESGFIFPLIEAKELQNALKNYCNPTICQRCTRRYHQLQKINQHWICKTCSIELNKLHPLPEELMKWIPNKRNNEMKANKKTEQDLNAPEWKKVALLLQEILTRKNVPVDNENKPGMKKLPQQEKMQSSVTNFHKTKRTDKATILPKVAPKKSPCLTVAKGICASNDSIKNRPYHEQLATSLRKLELSQSDKGSNLQKLNAVKKSKVIFECSICLDNKPSHVFIPCGHLCICKQCVETAKRTKPFAVCIVCRSEYEKIVQVYT